MSDFRDICREAIAEAQGWRMELRPFPFGNVNENSPRVPYWWHADSSRSCFGTVPLPWLNFPAAIASGESPDVSGTQSVHDTRSGGDSL